MYRWTCRCYTSEHASEQVVHTCESIHSHSKLSLLFHCIFSLVSFVSRVSVAFASYHFMPALMPWFKGVLIEKYWYTNPQKHQLHPQNNNELLSVQTCQSTPNSCFNSHIVNGVYTKIQIQKSHRAFLESTWLQNESPLASSSVHFVHFDSRFTFWKVDIKSWWIFATYWRSQRWMPFVDSKIQ